MSVHCCEFLALFVESHTMLSFYGGLKGEVVVKSVVSNRSRKDWRENL